MFVELSINAAVCLIDKHTSILDYLVIQNRRRNNLIALAREFQLSEIQTMSVGLLPPANVKIIFFMTQIVQDT